MKIIGITGRIGSGKSTVAHELARRGYTVYDCDKEAKRLIAEDIELQKSIIALLGKESFVNGKYNTVYVSSRVFKEKEMLASLNAIIHPAVAKDIKQQAQLIERVGKEQPFFVESAILYESNLVSLCSSVFVIDAPDELCIARTIARDYNGQATPETINKVRARIETQRDDFREEAIVLNNDGSKSIEELADQIIALTNQG